jgi:excisionase family DNA binding protein
MFTVKDISKRLCVSARMVYKLVETGKLSAYRIGTAIRISDEQLQAYLNGCERRRIANEERPATLRRLRI